MITYFFNPDQQFHILDPKTKQFMASADSHTEAAAYAQKKSAERNLTYLVMEIKERAIPQRIATLQKFQPAATQGF